MVDFNKESHVNIMDCNNNGCLIIRLFDQWWYSGISRVIEGMLWWDERKLSQISQNYNLMMWLSHTLWVPVMSGWQTIALCSMQTPVCSWFCQIFAIPYYGALVCWLRAFTNNSLRDVELIHLCIFQFYLSFYELVSWALDMKLVLGECNWIRLR